MQGDAPPPPPPPYGPPAGQPPPYPYPSSYPAWQPAPPPQRRSPWLVIGGVGVALVLAVALALTVVRTAVHLGSPVVALAAPSSISGLPKTADYSTQPVTVLGRHVLDIASATYGSGDVRYAVVALSEPAGNRQELLQAMTPQFIGDDRADASSTTHLRQSGVDYTCYRMTGALPGASCTWDDAGVAGVVLQLGSTDMGRCADFADVARTAVRHG